MCVAFYGRILIKRWYVSSPSLFVSFLLLSFVSSPAPLRSLLPLFRCAVHEDGWAAGELQRGECGDGARGGRHRGCAAAAAGGAGGRRPAPLSRRHASLAARGEAITGGKRKRGLEGGREEREREREEVGKEEKEEKEERE